VLRNELLAIRTAHAHQPVYSSKIAIGWVQRRPVCQRLARRFLKVQFEVRNFEDVNYVERQGGARAIQTVKNDRSIRATDAVRRVR
jgi:alpha-amylase/alpha-mannosidase (GH57 family)